jgi:hypothetical protein
VVVRAMSQSVVVSLAPSVDTARPGEGNRELRTALDLDHPQSGQGLDFGGDFAAVTATPAKFSIVPITPRPDIVVVGDAQGLSVTTSTSHVNNTVTLKIERLSNFNQVLILCSRITSRALTFLGLS